ncbi:unnamed protein product [Rotaria sordida]|uniref:Uncharacterized protein n=1 Tax=Rotaria sordida TaxID=392033 RepID=A0A819K5Y2_9BILA|nr:unnamed protein product [Rotaria sordida]
MSVVRAMDAIQQFLGQQNIIVPEEFVIGGASKRGWMSEDVASGESYLRRIPNTGHSITEYEESLLSFYLSVADRVPLPSMKWTRTVNGTHGIIHAVIDFSAGRPKPANVTVYQARTRDILKRDFRRAKLDQTYGNVVFNPIIWTNTAVQFEEQTGSTISYSLIVSIPTDGYWIAALLQASFSGREGTTLTLTTETLILPNTYPVKECYDQECYGRLV